MNPGIPHPDSPGLAQREIAPRFSRYRQDGGTDPFWHFQLLVDRTSRLAAANLAVPQPGGPLVSMALFTRQDPAGDIEILGQSLQVEIDPADWLDWWLGEAKITPLSVKRLHGTCGAVGDVVGSWTAGNTSLIGRFFAFKGANRLIFLSFRCAAADYAKLAEDFLLSIATFSLLKDSPDKCAEELQWIECSSPVHCRVPVPASWEVRREIHGQSGSAFCADFSMAAEAAKPGEIIEADHGVSAAGPAGPMLMAQVSFALIPSEDISDHEQAIAGAIATLNDAGVSISREKTISEAASPPFIGSWFTIGTAESKGQKSDFRCRILRHPNAWVIAVSVSVDRQTSMPAWMRSKRLLDVMTTGIDFPKVK